MDISRSKTKELNDRLNVIKKAEKMEILKRRREINARYSRLLLSKTIQHFKDQGHVSIRISKKLNDNENGHSQYTINDKKQNLQFQQPKRSKTMSFWQLPTTLECEFQIETNTSRGLKNVTTQTNFPKCYEENENSWHTSEPSNQKFDKNISVSSEIISSKLSSEGNIMSLVLRTKRGDHVNDQNEIIQSAKSITSSPHTPRRKYKFRNAERSKNFWTLYNNFIICNRSIELRITKLFSFRNVQYIVAFSENFFDDGYDRSANTLLKKNSCHLASGYYYVIQFIRFNLEACIFECCSVEHVIELTVMLEYKDENTDIIQGPTFEPAEGYVTGKSNVPFDVTGNDILGCRESKEDLQKQEFLANSPSMNSETIDLANEAKGNGLRKEVFSLNKLKTVTMKISCVIISVWVVYLFLRIYSC